MSLKHSLDRLYARLHAFIYGYSWGRCFLCGNYYGGHEAGRLPYPVTSNFRWVCVTAGSPGTWRAFGDVGQEYPGCGHSICSRPECQHKAQAAWNEVTYAQRMIYNRETRIKP